MPLLKTVLNKLKGLEGKTEDTGWDNLDLLTGWQVHSAGQNPAQYEKKNGVVYLHGCILTNTGTASGNRNIAQLPVSCRPSGIKNNLYFSARIISGSESILGHVQITPAGIIMGAGNLKQNDWFALDGISFPVAD